MRINRSSGYDAIEAGNAIDAIQSNLEAIARSYKTNVSDLIKLAHDSGDNASDQLRRVLVLEKRLNKLIECL